MKRHVLSILAAVLPLRATMSACGSVPVGLVEPHGLESRVCREVPYEPFEPLGYAFEWLGFMIWNGWI